MLASTRQAPQTNSNFRLASSRCRCAGCGAYFNSGTTFDGHRVGPYAPINQPSSRRCLTAAELSAKGWLLNRSGFWISESRAERQERRGRTHPSGVRPKAAPEQGLRP